MKNVFYCLISVFIFVLSICDYAMCRGATGGLVTNDDDTFFAHLSKMDIPEKFKLSEILIGNPKATVELIIYFSFTCPHCRIFHQNEFPKFKKKYIDTGKIKIIFRNYIDDQGALEAAQIVRCLCGASVKEYIKLSGMVLANQVEWLKSSNPPEFLKKIFERATFYSWRVKECLKRADIGAGLLIEQKRAMNQYGLSSVPAFVVGEQIWIGAITCEELEEFCGFK